MRVITFFPAHRGRYESIHDTSEGEPVMLEILHAAQFLKETAEALPYPTVAKLLATK